MSVHWWNIYYQTSCLSADNQEFDSLEKAKVILQMNEKDVLLVESKWLNHLPMHNEKYISDEFRKENYPYCLNYTLIKVEDKELQLIESKLPYLLQKNLKSTAQSIINDLNCNLYKKFFR